MTCPNCSTSVLNINQMMNYLGNDKFRLRYACRKCGYTWIKEQDYSNGPLAKSRPQKATDSRGIFYE